MGDDVLREKAELLAMTSSAGWRVLTRYAEATCRDLESKALLEEDDAKANGLRRDARGARKFLDGLLQRVEMTKQLDSEPTEDNFLEICM